MPKKPTPFNAAVGKRLERLRGTRGLDQTEMANLLGVTHDRYWTWEKGTALISPIFAEILVNHFGVTLDWIYRERSAGVAPDIFKGLTGARGS